MTCFGLIGFPLLNSSSPAYFEKKFLKEGLRGYRYDLFPMESIQGLPGLIRANPEIRGLNVTIPHKVAVIELLQELDPVAEAVAAVNTIDVFHSQEKTILKGYNTDVTGFEQSLIPLLKPFHKRALVLGTGGASRAVSFVLERLGIPVTFVSRKPANADQLCYEDVNSEIIGRHQLIVQTSPLGKHPDAGTYPSLPYQYLRTDHLLYDLNYNPGTTRFLQFGAQYGATVKNGLEMLHLQADASWNIWRKSQKERG